MAEERVGVKGENLRVFALITSMPSVPPGWQIAEREVVREKGVCFHALAVLPAPFPSLVC